MNKQLLKSISFYKTLYFNFRYFPIKDAIRLPVFISKNVYLKCVEGKIKLEAPISRGLIKIGFGTVGIFDERKFRAIWFVSGEVVFKGSANIGYGSKIDVAENGSLTIGNNLQITAASSIISHKNIQIGDNCLMSWDVLIMDTDLHLIKDANGITQNDPREIIIGNNVWIGCRCLILKGSQIPSFSVIGANTVINKILDDESALYAGSPARKIKDDITWQL